MNFKNKTLRAGANQHFWTSLFSGLASTNWNDFITSRRKVERKRKPNTHCDLNDFITTERRPKYCAFIKRSMFCGFELCPWAVLQGEPVEASTHAFLCANGSCGPSDPLLESVGAFFFYNFRRKWIGKRKHNAPLKIETNNLRAHNWRVNETSWKRATPWRPQDRVSGAKPQSVNYPGLWTSPESSWENGKRTDCVLGFARQRKIEWNWYFPYSKTESR